MNTVSVRYIVDDVEQAIGFYRDQLGFELDMHPAPGFAMMHTGDLRLLLNTPGAGGAGRAAPEGSTPEPGGWNRFQLSVADLDAVVTRLKDAGVALRTEIVTGNGGRQALAQDPAGNPIELFEPHQA